MTNRSHFGPKTTADEVLQGLDLSGQRAIVTGASGGLGAEAARALARAGAAVTLTARDLAKAEQVVAGIRAADPRAEVELRLLELSEPASVRRFATEWLADHHSLQMLILNAAVMACPLRRTAEGWELQFATNHLGHFLLAQQLAPALLAGAPARVVAVSSGGHQISPVVFDDIHFERRAYEPWSAYGQAKTANVLFAVELDRRLRERGVRAFAVHPGMIGTDLGRYLTRETIAQIRSRASDGGEPAKSIPQGAATEVWAATAAKLTGRGGIYLSDCSIAPPAGPGVRGYAPHAVDPAAAARLWQVTEQTLGERFDT